MNLFIHVFNFTFLFDSNFYLFISLSCSFPFYTTKKEKKKTDGLHFTLTFFFTRNQHPPTLTKLFN